MATDNAIADAIGVAPNIGSNERWLTAIAGGTLATYGLIARTPVSLFMAAAGVYLVARGASGYCPAYAASGVDKSETTGTDKDAVRKKLGAVGIKVTHAVTVLKPVSELYAYWRDFTNLPHIMDHLESVTVQDGGKSHWVAKAPLGKTVAWDAEIINEVENEVIAWRSLPGADVDNAGAVTFKPGPVGRGTVVRVELSYAPPAGKAGAAVAKLLGEEPTKQLDDDLRHFKQLMETGERPTTEGQSSGRGPDKDQVK
ncbi:MAG: SRPBCC family protein [Janthinobacterium lividum]